MDMARLGLVVRALRRRRGWRQIDLARAARISQSLVSLIERGHGDRVTTDLLRRVAAAVDGRLVVEVRGRAGDLDRLLDEGHARLVAVMATRLRDLGWEERLEVTYESGRSSGSIDILAWHPPTSHLLVIEIKTEIPSAEATLRKLDEKVRVASAVAMERFGWSPGRVSRLLVVEATSTNRRRIESHRPLFDGALPQRDDAVRAWLRWPADAIDGRLFVATSNRSAGIHVGGGRHRVRPVKRGAARSSSRSSAEPSGVVEPASRPPTVVLRG
jgi:transcriptional regulator with XRE-family HTH domain